MAITPYFDHNDRRETDGGNANGMSVDNDDVNTHPPPERNWVMIRHADPERPIATFTVLCYNVLCDKYATVNQYSYCPSWALNWEYRKTLIIKEIRTYEADVITLQESLARLGILGPFDPQWVQSNKILGNVLSRVTYFFISCPGFPHPHVASDHIPIMAQYAIIPTTHQRQPPPPQQTGHPPPVGVIGGGYPAPPQHSFLR
ncbi:hypothetical protein CRE_29265 [Caenorhabditis remanei]|uniref:Endonuclease/exonuclease/phosphatase domain-containing protein n=1 Tax=Caenorhabditis remanei TaxID=31234 RepID=E3NPF9_CAERE|nr:hypothetical protein CRE_29265 [Caenorhabditis remanei]